MFRILRRLVQGALLIFVATLVVAIVDGWRAFGRGAHGDRLTRMHASPQWDDGAFENPQPLYNDTWATLAGLFGASDHLSPDPPLSVTAVDPARFASPPPTELRVTWLGHSTLLLEIDGYRILTDPVWGPRTSPLSWIGPARWYAPPIALEDLPTLDAVVISHDHYDHLDYPTIAAMRDWDTTFVVPLGVAAHLEYWGVPASRIVELDWDTSTRIGELQLACLPARHASGRTLFDKDATLWASWAIVGPRHRAWFSGDTGLFPGLRAIGERFGPFDLTMIEAGAYGAGWPDWHLGPEQAVRAHQMVGGNVMLPIHWGLFALAYHGWTEPVERVLVAAQAAGVTVLTPWPGQSIEPAKAPPRDRWWPSVAWQTAAQSPIVATRMDEAD